MKNKNDIARILCIVLVLGLALFFIGCEDLADDPMANIRVINETGRAISNVRFIGSDGSVIPVEEITRQGWGHRGNQGHCRLNQNENYTLTWECPIGGPMFAQAGGYCGGMQNGYRFQFRSSQQQTIVLSANNTWAFVN